MSNLDFPNKLKFLRQNKGITQEKLAKELFVSRTLVTKFETGKAIPTPDTLKRIATYFDVSIDDLLSNEDVKLLIVQSNAAFKSIRTFFIIASIFLTICILLIYVLPLFSYGHYVDDNKYVYGNVSLMSAFFKSNNPLCLISFAFGLLVLIILCFDLWLPKISSKSKLFDALTFIAYAILISLTIITIITGINIIFSGSFQMNTFKKI